MTNVGSLIGFRKALPSGPAKAVSNKLRKSNIGQGPFSSLYPRDLGPWISLTASSEFRSNVCLEWQVSYVFASPSSQGLQTFEVFVWFSEQTVQAPKDNSPAVFC